jgi:hypothetical protein
MKTDNVLKAAGLASIGAAGALANAHVIDPSVLVIVTAIVNFVLGLFHTKPINAS